MMLKEVYNFLKTPVYQEDENINLKYRLSMFLKLLGLALVISIGLGILIGALESTGGLQFGKHAFDKFLDQYSMFFIVFVAVVLAPLIEELIFRAPLVFFKKSPFFKYVFYLFTAIFGFYHITNFEINSTVLLFSPLLVLPQLSVGTLLGFIRVRFGLLWAIGLHAAYNFILVVPFVLVKFLNIPLE